MIYHEEKIPVRYYETDQMAVVHHSNYIRYFECARDGLLVACGYPVEECDRDGFTFPVVSIECKYKYPARMGDVLTVSAAVEKVPLAKFVIRQEVRNQDGVVCAYGTVILGFLSKETGKPIGCPEKLSAIIESKLQSFNL